VSDWLDFRVSRPIQLHIDPFEYSCQVTGDLGIPEADDAITLPLKPKLPFTITFGSFILVVMSAVEFNDEMCAGQRKSTTYGPMGACRRKCVPSTGNSFRARHNTRSCGVELARNRLAAVRRIDVETICAAHPTPPAPDDAPHRRARTTLPLQGRVSGAHS
jgi:hypothetical protein